MERIIIAIDPDTERSGVATMVDDVMIKTESYSFPELIEYARGAADISEVSGRVFEVYVEAGWLNEKPNFHGKHGRVGEKIASAVGANWQTGKLIIETLAFYGINAVPVKPYKKIWRGPDGKITHDELASIKGVTLLKKRTNQDERDAALIAIYQSGMPIIMTK